MDYKRWEETLGVRQQVLYPRVLPVVVDYCCVCEGGHFGVADEGCGFAAVRPVGFELSDGELVGKGPTISQDVPSAFHSAIDLGNGRTKWCIFNDVDEGGVVGEVTGAGDDGFHFGSCQTENTSSFANPIRCSTPLRIGRCAR